MKKTKCEKDEVLCNLKVKVKNGTRSYKICVKELRELFQEQKEKTISEQSTRKVSLTNKNNTDLNEKLREVLYTNPNFTEKRQQYQDDEEEDEEEEKIIPVNDKLSKIKQNFIKKLDQTLKTYNISIEEERMKIIEKHFKDSLKEGDDMIKKNQEELDDQEYGMYIQEKESFREQIAEMVDELLKNECKKDEKCIEDIDDYSINTKKQIQEVAKAESIFPMQIIEMEKSRYIQENNPELKLTSVLYNDKNEEIVCKVSYYSLNENGKNPSKWKIYRERVGDISLNAKLYPGCDSKDNCNYIIKVMKIHQGSIGITFSQALNELAIQIEMANNGLAPMIYDAFYCRDYLKHGDTFVKTRFGDNETFLGHLCKSKKSCFIPLRIVYIVMEKKDLTVYTFLEQFKTYYTAFDTYSKKLQQKAIKIIETAYSKLKIIHGDAHSSNFMFDLTDSGKKHFFNMKYGQETPEQVYNQDKTKDFFGSFSSLVAIDFGASMKNINTNTEFDTRKIMETFNMNLHR